MRAIFKKLILVALLLFLLLPISTEEAYLPEPTQGKEYTAITYNIHRGTNVNGVSSLDAIADILKQENPDFVALQEVDKYNIRSGFQDQIKWLSNKLGMNYVFGSNLNFAVTEYGNGILSKYPILDSGQIMLAYEYEPRSLLWAKVETEDGILYLTSIHLGLDTQKRAEHFTIIEDFINSLDAPVLVMGDLNVLPDNQLLSQFRARTTGQLNYKITPTYINEAPIQIDYIFGKSVIELDSYSIPSDASDHFPLIFKFKFKTVDFIYRI